MFVFLSFSKRTELSEMNNRYKKIAFLHCMNFRY